MLREVEVVLDGVVATHAAHRELVDDLVFAGANTLVEGLDGADAGGFGADWVLRLIMQDQLVVSADKLLSVEFFGDAGRLDLIEGGASCVIELGHGLCEARTQRNCKKFEHST